MSHYEPRYPFDGYDDSEYGDVMMDFIVRHESLQARELGDWLYKALEPKSVIDIGCGPGIYLLPYAVRGCEILGVDACSSGGKSLGQNQYIRHDLRYPFSPEKRYDLAICMEVAEHLERHWSERLVDSLCDCADVVLWSAAVPGQGGTYHYNEQPHEFWLDMFRERHGYYVDEALTAKMRKFLSKFTPERERGEVSGWLLDNSFIIRMLEHEESRQEDEGVE